MHIQLISCQDHLPSAPYLPVQLLLIDGEEVELSSPTLTTAIFAELDDTLDVDDEGYLRGTALDTINTFLDPGHANYDPDWYDPIHEAVVNCMEAA